MATTTYVFAGTVVWLLLFVVGNGNCLAAESNGNGNTNINAPLPFPSSPASVIVSTKRNGGHERLLYLLGEETHYAQQQQATSAAVSSSTSTAAATVAVTTTSKKQQHHNLMERYWWKSLYSRMKSSFRSTFLPRGYPASVPSGYMKYSVYSCLQDLTTNIRGVLATQRVLQGVGVGSATSTALSATQNFLMRDAAGMFATLVFTSWTSGNGFQMDIKRWRYFADIMVDIGITLEVSAIHVPKIWFVPMICIGNMCKAICGVAAGACGNSINLFWAQQPKSGGGGGATTDISDITAKSGAQHTVTGALGLIVSAFVTQTLAHAPLKLVWTVYTCLTIMHLYANYYCMRLISFDYVNTIRMNMLLNVFLDRWSQAQPTRPLPSPLQIGAVEPIVFGQQRIPFFRRPSASLPHHQVPIHFGVSFNEYVQRSTSGTSSDDATKVNSSDSILTRSLLQSTSDGGDGGTSSLSSSYWITKGAASSSKNRCCIVVALSPHANINKAYFHAVLLQRILILGQKNPSADISATERRKVAEQVAWEELELAWGQFANDCQLAGWDLSRTELHTRGYQVDVR